MGTIALCPRIPSPVALICSSALFYKAIHPCMYPRAVPAGTLGWQQEQWLWSGAGRVGPGELFECQAGHSVRQQ